MNTIRSNKFHSTFYYFLILLSELFIELFIHIDFLHYRVVGIQNSDTVASDGSSETFKTDCENRQPSMAIVQAIATIEGVEPTAVDFSLYEAIDPEALNALVCSDMTEGDVVIQFTTDEYQIQVQSDETVTVEYRTK